MMWPCVPAEGCFRREAMLMPEITFDIRVGSGAPHEAGASPVRLSALGAVRASVSDA
jgi:hypothetical protein